MRVQFAYILAALSAAVEVRKGVFVEMCQKKDCVLAADHPPGKHRSYRVSMLACPHNVPNFGPSCPICDGP